MKLKINGKVLALMLVLFLAGCGEDMRNDSKLKPYEPSKFFKGSSSRLPVKNTVPWTPDDVVVQKPKTTLALMKRGQERFNIYCAVCHGRTGEGNGIVVQRGFAKPPSFHEQRLRDVDDQYIYDVITNGFGQMYDYSMQLNPEERWAVVSYIRSLQYSRQVPVSKLSEAERTEVEKELM
jgi:mono/diheme cytochrome c family protein